MNLLFPLFALAVAAVAIPILLHFRRQPPQKTVPFSTLMFLEQTPVPPKTRRKLEDWLLLLLRCLALLLLALMFGRPLLRSAKGEQGDGKVAWCVLMDTSASMQREGAWKQVQAALDETLKKIHEEDSLTLMTFDHEVRTLLTSEAWASASQGSRRTAALGVMQQVKPGWGGTNLGQALVMAAQQLSGADGKGREKRIVLLSDLQEGVGLESLHASAWPEDVQVSMVRIDAPWKGNFSLALASAVVEEDAAPVSGSGEATAPPERTRDAARIRVRVSSSREAGADKFTLRWSTGGESVEAAVPAGGSRILTAPAQDGGKSEGRLDLSGDALDFDNHVYVAKPLARAVRVLCVGRGLSRTETASPLFYLARAIQPTPALTPQLREVDMEDILNRDLLDADLVLLFGEASERTRSLLQPWVESGGSVVNVLSEGSDGTTLRAMGGGSDLKVRESDKDAMLQNLDFGHPLLQTFAASGVRDFTKIRFWKHRLLEGIEKVEGMARVAMFDDGSPAWVEWPHGKGRVLVMTGGWQPSDSQLALASKFVPLLYSMLNWAVGESGQAQSLVVGDVISAQAGWTGVLSVQRPDGKTDSWDLGQSGSYTRTDLPGIYVVGEGASARSVAVNLAPGEGRLAPLDLQRLTEAGVKLNEATGPAAEAEKAQMSRKLEDAEQEQRQKGWRLLLLGAILVLLLETWLAGRQRRAAEPASTAAPAAT